MSQYPAPPPFNAPSQDHPQTTTILILGICALVLCQVLGPFAWLMGNKALAEIDASGGQIGGRDLVNVGRILGMVSSIILGLAVLFVVVVIVVAALSAIASSS